MNRFLIAAASLIISIASIRAQELSWRDGWTAEVSSGAYTQASHLNREHIGKSLQGNISKWLTPVFALSLDAQYRHQRSTLTPMLRTDIVALFDHHISRNRALASDGIVLYSIEPAYPVSVFMDLGVGWGHYFERQEQTDHNYHVYVARLSLVPHVSDRLDLLLSIDSSSRTYSSYIGIVPDRTDLSVRIGIILKM